MESENGTDAKISDSGYSVSCNSNSQKSACSKSRHSGSNSSRSSGYCGATNPDASISDGVSQISKRNKDKEHKKKKLKSFTTNSNFIDIFEGIPVQNHRNTKDTPKETPIIEAKSKPTIEEPTEIANEILESSITDSGHCTTSENKSDEDAPGEKEDSFWKEEKINEKENEDHLIEPQNLEQQSTELNEKTNLSQPENGFCCVISIYDGVVLYTTPSLTSVLGFPKDMWLGRSFIDFVHPKDRETFSSQVTMGIALPLVNSQDVKNSLYVCLRKYRGLKSGFGVVEKPVSYQAFQLTVTFKRVTEAPGNRFLDNNSNVFLVVAAVPVHSAYKIPKESRKSSTFGMRHTAACIFSHVDPDIVTNFGFLPQDMLGKSVFDFYHPEDMPFMKEIYESVMGMRRIAGSVFKSKPYRFAVQNGGFAMIETEWSSFVNPWSRRLEFVIGLHRVIQGPQNPDIFETPHDEQVKMIPEEIIRNGKIVQAEILLLLNREIARPTGDVKQEVSKRCKDLANFMESLMDEVKICNLQLEVPLESDPAISDRDSVMLGEISPHREYYDSKSSSETPPSYNQLNYNDNIQRFFQSKPKTTNSDGSAEKAGASRNVSETYAERKVSSSAQVEGLQNQKCLSPMENSGTSGSDSAGNMSSGSNQIQESRTTSANSNDSYKNPHLTEAILNKHNENMEKIMIKKHKEFRFNTKESKKGLTRERVLNISDKNNQEKSDNLAHIHGVKRAGSHSWEGDNHKVSKYKHQIDMAHNGGVLEQSKENLQPKRSNISQQPVQNTLHSQQPILSDVNLWPPFSVTPPNNTSNCQITTTPGGTGFTTGMFPIYYIPTQRPMTECFDSNNPSRYQVHYMPGMIYNYNTIFSTPPIMCSPLPVVPFSVPPSITSVSQENHQSNGLSLNNQAHVMVSSGELKSSPPGVMSMPQFQRPASQATSVKAEPGSILGSIASASVVIKDSSECSRKDAGLLSVCSPNSPLVAPPDGDGDMDYYNINKKNTTATNCHYRDNAIIDEGSSYYSSSYSSFFKTDTGSGSNDDSNADSKKKNSDDQNSWKRNKSYPIRKREAPWLKGVSVTPDLVYRYQMAVKGIEDILESDLTALKNMQQPSALNDQLNQLYLEMDFNGLPRKLTLEEGGFTSTSSSDEASFSKNPNGKKKRRSYSSLVMIYEDNAPLPPPDE